MLLESGVETKQRKPNKFRGKTIENESKHVGQNREHRLQRSKRRSHCIKR